MYQSAEKSYIVYTKNRVYYISDDLIYDELGVCKFCIIGFWWFSIENGEPVYYRAEEEKDGLEDELGLEDNARS